MRLSLSNSDISSIKHHLGKAFPSVSPSKRIEAAAKGLGYNSYAAMRKQLSIAPSCVAPNETVFLKSLGLESANDNDGRGFSRSMAKVVVERILNEHQSLTPRGFDHSGIVYDSDRSLTFQGRQLEFEYRRKEAMHDRSMDEFELAMIYLEMQGRRKTINHNFSSYGLKHRAEGLSRREGKHTHLGNYVSNGMFIVAALASGFQVQQIGRTYNACFNISSRTIRSTADGPVTTRHQQQAVVDWAMESIRRQG